METDDTGGHINIDLSKGTVIDFTGSIIITTLGGLLLLCAAYGGVHMSAWNFYFPSRVEKLLLRASCVTSAAGGLISPVWLLLANHFEEDNSPLLSQWVSGFKN